MHIKFVTKRIFFSAHYVRVLGCTICVTALLPTSFLNHNRSPHLPVIRLIEMPPDLILLAEVTGDALQHQGATHLNIDLLEKQWDN